MVNRWQSAVKQHFNAPFLSEISRLNRNGRTLGNLTSKPQDPNGDTGDGFCSLRHGADVMMYFYQSRWTR